MIETKVTFNVRPFATPSLVEEIALPTQDGLPVQPVRPNGPLSLPIFRLDVEAISALCDKFRADVFEKAGKADPNERAVEQPGGSSPMMNIYVCEGALDILGEEGSPPSDLIPHWYDVRIDLLVPKEGPGVLSARVPFGVYLDLVRARSPADLYRLLDSIAWDSPDAE